MASASPSIDMEQESSCPICLEYLTDPVVLDCGHSFCHSCITNYCEKWETLGALECPVCKFKFQKGDFRRNWQLANLVEKIKLMPLSSGKEYLCLRHKETLHLFCKEDEKLVCFVCERSPEHQGHTVLLLAEAAQQQKDKIFNCLKTLRTEREKVLEYIAEAEDKSQEMLEKLESVRQRTMVDFSSLCGLLKVQERCQMSEIEEVEKEVARKRDEYLARPSEELSSLKSLIQEMEEKYQQPASELLQNIRGTLQRYEKKETFENPKAFMVETTLGFLSCTYNPFLENAMKRFQDILTWAFPKLRVMITLDTASASPHLIFSEYQKSFQKQSTSQELSKDPAEHYGFVLGSEGFTAGCQFWDVLVRNGEGWAVGVARKPVRERVTFSPEEGIWAVGRWKGQNKAFIKGTDPPLPLRKKLDYIRVCLNYEYGQVIFYDAETSSLVYEFSGFSFCGKTLHPFFAVYGNGCLELFP